MVDARVQQANVLMNTFARDSGLVGSQPPRRYLWTDAHAVCNWLALEHQLDDRRCLDLAVALVAQVHDVLGRHRVDDARSGWISGLAESEGRQHPTIGGLRIGKPLPERPPEALLNERDEWDQDGQYYHYLTKWMHALYRLGCRTGDAEYLRWAMELALAAHRGFRARTDPARLFWKMSIDLTYPLVTSSGHHDPLDGLITCLVLRGKQAHPELDGVIADLKDLCAGRNWLTDDPLGIGGLLFDAGRLAQLQQSLPDTILPHLLIDLLDSAALGLGYYVRTNTQQLPATHRLAFRELGLAIGLQAFELIQACAPGARALQALERLRPYLSLQPSIEDFWLQTQHRDTLSWKDHQDINGVMLATSLLARGFLSISET